MLFDVQQLRVALSGTCIDQNCFSNALQKFDSSINPIPANEVLTIETSLLSENETLVLKIINELGQVVIEEEIKISDKKTFVNTKELSNSFYFLSLEKGTDTFIKKFVVSH